MKRKSNSSLRQAAPRLSGLHYGTALSGLIVLFITMTGVLTAEAGDILRGGNSGSAASGGTGGSGGGAAVVTQMRVNAQDMLARTTQAMQAVTAMQAAPPARSRQAMPVRMNLGLDPNHIGQQLPNVPNGLAAGGLAPDSGIATTGVANAVATWQTP